MEKYDVINVINKEIEREKDLCRKYVKLNPSDKDRREKLRDAAIAALLRVMDAV
jgi:hypothetical protein